MSRGQPRHRSQNARRILERCQNMSNSKDAIIIDDDTENADVVQIDTPSTSNLGSKNVTTTNLNCLPRGIIYIDDEEEESSNISDDPANNPFAEAFDESSLSEDSDSDDSVMFVGNGNVCCDQSAPSRNNYGLYLDPESSTSENTNLNSDAYEFDNSNSDCEIIEDCSGNIREQWEKAASKKGCCPFTSDQATSSSTTVYPEELFPQNATVGNSFENISSAHFEEMFPEFDLRNSNVSEDSPSINIYSVDENVDFCLGTTENMSANQSYLNSHIPYEELGNLRKDDESNPNHCPQTAQSEDDAFSFNNDAQEPGEDSFFAYQSCGKTCFTDKEEPSTKTSCAFSTGYTKQASKANFISPENVEQIVDEFSNSAESKDKMVAEQEFAYSKEGKKGYIDDSFLSSTPQYEEPVIHAEGSINCSKMDGIMDNNVELIEGSDLGQTLHNEPDTSHFYGNLLGEREQHKKTEEYRRVAEEEWASRQQQLQIQAEEAQRMRRRRKAEKTRLLDMEKRQKQRLEEIRDLQKKDDEITQLKERIRVVVRKDLERLEMNCKDMASVLRALGIHVKGGIYPMMHELNAAYRQALLRFHPDRAPRTDIQRQIEAEEKFKLISRLKEKLLL